MASRQATEKRAEAAGNLAASDISDVNKEREKEAAERIEVETEQLYYQHQQKPSVTRSVLGAAQDTYEQAKEAVARKIHDATEGTKETKDSPEQKAGKPEGGIYGIIKDKFSQPEQGKMVVGVEEKPTGTVAKTIKASDETTNQSSDQAGLIGEQGIGRPRTIRLHSDLTLFS